MSTIASKSTTVQKRVYMYFCHSLFALIKQMNGKKLWQKVHVITQMPWTFVVVLQQCSDLGEDDWDGVS